MPTRVSTKLGDLLPDNPDRDNPGVLRAENVLPHRTSYQPAPDMVVESEPINEYCLGVGVGVDAGGTVHTYAGDKKQLYERNGLSWDDASRVPGGDYALPANTHRWVFSRFHNISDDSMNMVAADGVDPLQEQTDFSGTFDDIVLDPGVPGNTDPVPPLRYITVVNNFLVGGWTAIETSLVQWSGQGNHRVWTPTVAQSDRQVIQRGGQVTGVVGGEYGVIFMEKSIWRMRYVGAPVVFQFDEVAPGQGTIIPGSIAQHGNNIFYIDSDGFYIFDGNKATPIGTSRVNDTFLADFDGEYGNSVVSAVDAERSLVWWAYPSHTAPLNADGQKTPDKILVFEFTSGRFAGPLYFNTEQLMYSRTEASFLLDDITVANFPNAATISGTCFGSGPDGTCVDLDMFNHNLDAALFQGGKLTMQAFNNQHAQASFSGPNLTGTIETAEVALRPGQRSFVTGARPLVEGNAPDISVRVGTREETYGNPTWSIPKDLNARTGLANFRENARYHRVEITVGGDFEHIFGTDVEFEQAGDL